MCSFLSDSFESFLYLARPARLCEPPSLCVLLSFLVLSVEPSCVAAGAVDGRLGERQRKALLLALTTNIRRGTTTSNHATTTPQLQKQQQQRYQLLLRLLVQLLGALLRLLRPLAGHVTGRRRRGLSRDKPPYSTSTRKVAPPANTLALSNLHARFYVALDTKEVISATFDVMYNNLISLKLCTRNHPSLQGCFSGMPLIPVPILGVKIASNP